MKKVFKKGPGDRLSAGLAIDSPFRSFEKEAGEPRSLPPLRLIPGCPRPMQTGRILKGATSLVVGGIETLSTDLGEKPYLQSGFFKGHECSSHFIPALTRPGSGR